MATTARPQNRVLRRTMTTDSTPSSSAPSVSVSPADSPTQSPSATSLSSLGSVDEPEVKNTRGVLLDTYGNEFEIPDYTIKQIRDAIPAHCFERSGLRGLGYVARDMASLAATFYLFHNYVTPENIPNTAARAGLWAVYTFVQGLFGTGLWVLAHECGHQSFSPSKILNDTVGWVCHSLLLVPYFSWKISHGKHHKATGNMERDMVHMPKTREEYASRVGKLAHQLHELTEETPIATAIHLLTQQLGGWLVWYFIPYLWINHWLVAITFLQHTDPTLPHYDAQIWNFTRGAAATIDREFGFIGRTLLHGIIETHVLHHYISTIPFYHADEASEAIKPVMGKHYRSDTEGGSLGFIRAMWKCARMCQWVEPSEGAQGEGKGVLFYRNRNGLGVPPQKIAAPVIKPTAGKGAKMEVGPDSDLE